MAKFFESAKWKKRLALGLSLTMAATLAFGVFSACKTTDTEEDDEDDTAAIPADTQLLKNGNFEFYSEMTKEEKDLRVILNTPTSWSFSSGSPASDTKSGLIDLKYWDSISKSSYEYKDVQDAYTNWDKGSIYDKLFFFYKCDNSENKEEYKNTFEDVYDGLSSSSAEKKFFSEHSFSSIDFDDVRYLKDDIGEGADKQVPLHDSESEDTGILMIHNRRTSDGAVGTAQSYSSSTTITLKGGTAAEISVWVKTAQLRHYYDDLKGEGDTLDGLPVTSEAGAYIALTHTVGGTTLDQMQIKNINTAITNPDNENNGWEKYTMYVRASTFATTTVKLVLGLGQGTSEDRYEAVNGYALFDDAQVKIIDNDAYNEAVKDIVKTDKTQGDYFCTINTKDKKDKLFDATKLVEKEDYDKTFALDLYAGFAPLAWNQITTEVDLTKEKSGNSIYTSEKIDKNLSNNIDNDGTNTKGSIGKLMTLSEITGTSQKNEYLKNIAEKDFENYPSAFSTDNILMLLSSNGAAYTAKLSSETFSLKKDDRMLISFFVKTSEVISGRSGASITLVDGENKTTISAFDSTKLDKVDIDDDTKDIYDGWVQCFFFISNETEEDKTFTLQFSIGPTSIVNSSKYSYGQGYAAFANFETVKLSKTELSYASTGDRAKKVSLTGIIEDTTYFDEADKVKDIETGLGTPVNFKGVLAGSKMLPPAEGEASDNKVPEGVLTGLLNYQHVENYNSILGGNDEKTWTDFFQDTLGKTALQPLVIMNKSGKAQSSYGYFATAATISANTYQKISLRVKLSAGAKATVYLTDTSEFGVYNNFITPYAPKVTYWYDEDGNICKSDPTEKGFDKNTGIAFELQTNGLYLKADSTDKTYYANLKNYKEKDGNLVTSDDTIAYYYHEGKYYAYRTEDANGKYSYSTEVKDLYENGGKAIARYDYVETSFPASKITVENTDATKATDWITVTFYVHTGSEAKNYRLEIWAGDRDNAVDGLKSDSYVFFDRYTSTTISNYDSLLKEAVADLEDDEDMELVDDKLPEEYAYYYTFTYYDSINYLRYDVNEDEDGVGNLYESYDQSSYSEQIIYLMYNDESGERTGTPSYIRFINYAASDVTVTPDSSSNNNSSSSDDDDHEPVSTGDILLIVSSSLLGVVIIFVIIMLVIRRLADKRKKTTKTAAVKDLRYRPSKKKAPEPEVEPEEEENPFVKNRKEKEAAEKAKKAEEIEVPAEEPVEEPAPAEEPEEPTEEPTEEPAPAEEPVEEPAPTEDGEDE